MEWGEGVQKGLELGLCKLRFWLVGAGKMGAYAFEMEVRAGLNEVNQGGGLGGQTACTTHACINFEMNLNLCMMGFGQGLELEDSVGCIDDLLEVVAQEAG